MNRPEMDEVDKQFMASLLPAGSMGLGFVCGLVYLLPDGTRAWKSYDTLDATLLETIGLLDLMKMEVLGRSSEVVRYLGFEPNARLP